MRTLSRFLLSTLVVMAAQLAHAGDDVLSADDRVLIDFTRGRNVSKVHGGSIGEKMARFKPKLRIKSQGLGTFPGNKGCLILMGEDTTKNNVWKIIYRREFDLDLASGKEFRWEGDVVEQGFDRTLAKSGYDYDGYIVVIKNSQGVPVIAKASKPYWIKDLGKAWGLKEGSIAKREDF